MSRVWNAYLNRGAVKGGIGFWKGYNSSARNPPSNGRNSSFIIRLISQRRRERKPKRIKNKLP